jgi:FtsH-binding integral membrane protein
MEILWFISGVIPVLLFALWVAYTTNVFKKNSTDDHIVAALVTIFAIIIGGFFGPLTIIAVGAVAFTYYLIQISEDKK